MHSQSSKGLSNQSKGLLFLLLVVGLAVLSGFLYKAKPYQFGLDVQGGIRFTYEMEFDKDPKVAAEQKKNVLSIQNNLVGILQNRASQSLGVVEGNVQPHGDTGFIVEVPGFTDIAKARETMKTTAKIIAYHATTVNTAQRDFRQFKSEGSKNDKEGNPYVPFIRQSDQKEIEPGDPEYRAMIDGWTKILEGHDLQKAEIQVVGENPQPRFFFSPDGAAKMEKWSRGVAGQEENLAFVLDGRVISIAAIKKDVPYLSGEAFIDGTFTPDYVKRLVTLLNSGALPVDLKETSSMTVDPTIGKQALEQMVKAGVVAFGITALFLLVYYVFPGFVALIALCLYVLFTLTALKLMNATFSLASIAGFILSVGMAVDANILVFERVKEEMREGRTLLTSVELGFKRAFPAILDSNMCTILTSLVLSIMGTGPVKGFATTLIVGVAISLFTAVVVVRSLLVFLVTSGIGNNPKLYGLGRSWFGEKMEATADTDPKRIIKSRKLWFMISLVTVLIGVPFFFMGGLKTNVEFNGGTEAVFALPATAVADSATITRKLEAGGFPGSVVKVGTTADGAKQVYATIPGAMNVDSKLGDQLASVTGLGVKPSVTSIGPSVAQETKNTARNGVIYSSILIVLYLAMRFGVSVGGFKNGIKFGMSAILALLHDVLVVVGLAAVVGFFFKWEVSALSITAMLTVIGFSVHDTIVIFDRIRENLRKPFQGETFEHLCDRSITRSVARSLNTSITVIVTLIILMIWGTPTPDLKFFCVAMLFGIISGTYSSIFNATPILWMWDNFVTKKRGPQHSLIAEAMAESARVRATQGQAATAATASGPAGGYGTVKRRNRVKDVGRQELDD